MKKGKLRGLLISLHHYIIFFLLTSFIISCCMLLFLSTMMRVTGVQFTENDISIAAKLTFANVVFLSLIFTVIDSIRRKLTMDIPTRRISTAADKIIRGDFSVRIDKPRGPMSNHSFGDIIDCFNTMAEGLSEVQMLSSDFISNVSHEIKTPLATIRNYATLLEAKELSDEERLEYARAISDASKRLSDLVSNILRLSKLENQQISASPERYDLSEQLCECLLSFEELWEKKSIRIETDIDDGVFVTADAEMLTLVWNNLFSNAVKFTECGGCISVSLKCEEQFAVVSVRDTGIGISPEVGSRIFDKFYQVDSSRATEGNGLGLALVKQIIDLTGSKISVESTPGIGTEFTVYIQKEHS